MTLPKRYSRHVLTYIWDQTKLHDFFPRMQNHLWDEGRWFHVHFVEWNMLSPATWRNISTGITGKSINIDIWLPLMSSEGRRVLRMKAEDEGKEGVRVVQYQRKENERAKMKRTRVSKNLEQNPLKKHHLWLHLLWWRNQCHNRLRRKKQKTNSLNMKSSKNCKWRSKRQTGKG